MVLQLTANYEFFLLFFSANSVVLPNFQDDVKAFEIDERTFYVFDDEGHMLDDDLYDQSKVFLIVSLIITITIEGICLKIRFQPVY